MPSDNALLGCVRKLLDKAEAAAVTPAEADPLTADPQLSPVRHQPAAVSAVHPRTGRPARRINRCAPAPGPASAIRRLTEVARSGCWAGRAPGWASASALPGSGPALDGRDLPRHHRCRIRHLP
jgi:hypothetical protein